MDERKKKHKRKSMGYCGVPQCNTYKSSTVSMYRLPKAVMSSPAELLKWKVALKMGKEFPKQFLICSRHFDAKYLLTPHNIHKGQFRVHLAKPAFPTENLPKSSVDKKRIKDNGRKNRHMMRSASAAIAEASHPKFTSPISNVTIPVGREAVLTCVVQDLGTYKVAWLRVDTQTILTIQNHVITKNHRVSIQYSEKNTWLLRIKDIKETDRGWYMCQINTDPMKSQMGYLDVVVPPDILDYPTSTDMVVREGSNVTLKCAATGSPQPTITWRREGGDLITLAGGLDVVSVEGTSLTISRVNRLHMGAYLCIASNGVPPTVSKRIMLIVHFPPMIWVQNQLVGAVEGQRITLECQSEAYPKSINYWTREKGEIVPQGGKFEPILTDNAYKVVMKLSIKSVTASDFGSYKCVAKNSLGDTDGTIKLYRIPRNSVNLFETYDNRHKDKARKAGLNYDANTITEHDSESLHKRKDVPLGEHNDESYEISNSSISIFNQINLNNIAYNSINLLLSIIFIEFYKFSVV